MSIISAASWLAVLTSMLASSATFSQNTSTDEYVHLRVPFRGYGMAESIVPNTICEPRGNIDKIPGVIDARERLEKLNDVQGLKTVGLTSMPESAWSKRYKGRNNHEYSFKSSTNTAILNMNISTSHYQMMHSSFSGNQMVDVPTMCFKTALLNVHPGGIYEAAIVTTNISGSQCQIVANEYTAQAGWKPMKGITEPDACPKVAPSKSRKAE